MSDRTQVLKKIEVRARKRDIRKRPRRLRRTPALREMVRETSLEIRHLIQPLFVAHGSEVREPISSMPDVFQLSVDQLEQEGREIYGLGIPAVLLFGIPELKDAIGSENFDPDGVIPRAVRELKGAVPELVVITDVCMCEYTSHGHCGVLSPESELHLGEGDPLNDETLKILDQAAVAHAEAGADIVAPSGMIDGMVGSIRSALDVHDFTHVAILSYAVKYASALYGPFREAAEGPPLFGDRKGHQMDPANAREALREAALDVEEGADFLMVKPSLPYLDIIYRLRERFPDVPLAAYHVSGEYSMVKAAAANQWIDERQAVLENLTGIRRAGADLIITYHAKDVAQWLGNGSVKLSGRQR